VALSKRAKTRLKMYSAAERKKVAAAARLLYEAELMGPKRAGEIQRFVKRQ
jgi:hypothetical protein